MKEKGILSPSEAESNSRIFRAMRDKELPTFPVTQTKKVEIDYFTNVWVKDESTQETGTHKDRMAWQVVMIYLDILTAKLNKVHRSSLPQFSLISAGSAALAIQTQLNKYGLPPLKVLTDLSDDKMIVSYLASIGCQVYSANLKDKILTAKEILRLTNNQNGFDLTSNQAIEPTTRFYDWMSYEILNENPDYVLVPYGTGCLYENIINIAKAISLREPTMNVYKGNRKKTCKCNFIGATTNNERSKAVKLFAPFRPFTISSPDWVEMIKMRGLCGKESRVIEVKEKNIILGNEVMQSLGIYSEYSGSAGMGLLYQLKSKIPKNSKILVINTGRAKFPWVE